MTFSPFCLKAVGTLKIELTVAISNPRTFWKNLGIQMRIVYKPQSAVKFATIVAHTGSDVRIAFQGTLEG